jgi:hypothetical protein
MYEFEKVYKMTTHKLKQLDIDTLVDHIIDLKHYIAYENMNCVCGVDKYTNINDYSYEYNNTKCDICSRCIRHNGCSIICDICKRYNCKDCTKKCVHCKGDVCKRCIFYKFPDWKLLGCKIEQRIYFLEFKIKRYFDVVAYHCIFPSASGYNFLNDRSVYCGEWSNCANICSTHFNSTDQLVDNALSMLPTELIKLCIDYFYVKMTGLNWNNVEMKNIREYEFEQMKVAKYKIQYDKSEIDYETETETETET